MRLKGPGAFAPGLPLTFVAAQGSRAGRVSGGRRCHSGQTRGRLADLGMPRYRGSACRYRATNRPVIVLVVT